MGGVAPFGRDELMERMVWALLVRTERRLSFAVACVRRAVRNARMAARRMVKVGEYYEREGGLGMAGQAPGTEVRSSGGSLSVPMCRGFVGL